MDKDSYGIKTDCYNVINWTKTLTNNDKIIKMGKNAYVNLIKQIGIQGGQGRFRKKKKTWTNTLKIKIASDKLMQVNKRYYDNMKKIIPALLL